MEWIKQHPYLAGIGILMAVVFLFVFHKSSSTSSGGVYVPGTSDADVQANIAASVQMASIQAGENANTNNLNAALQNTILTGRVQNQLAVLANTNTQTQASAAEQIAGETIAGQTSQANTAAQTQLAAIQAAIAAQSQQAQIGSQTQLSEAQIAAQIAAAQIAGSESIAGTQQQVSDAQTAAALRAQLEQIAVSEQINKQNVTGQLNLAAGTNEVSLQQIAAYLTGIQDSNQTALSVNNQNIAGNLQLAGINNNATEAIANLNAGTAVTLTNSQNETLLQELVAQIGAQETLQNATIGYQTNTNNQVLNSASGLGPNNYAATLAAILGQPGVAQQEIQGQPGTGTNTASILNSIGNLFSGVGRGFSYVF
jgi:hypothetical protein